jgi:hypothetical protein
MDLMLTEGVTAVPRFMEDAEHADSLRLWAY